VEKQHRFASASLNERKSPALSGTIAQGGSDWPLIRRDDASNSSAHYTMIASDGRPVLVVNNGMRVSRWKWFSVRDNVKILNMRTKARFEHDLPFAAAEDPSCHSDVSLIGKFGEP
jgi:hypothetical protein